MRIRKISVVVERTSTGFSAYAKDYPVYTTGRTFHQLNLKMLEAMNLFFEGEGVVISPKQLEFQADLKQFFQHYRVINARFLAERIGMNPTLLSQYAKGRKKASVRQTERIMKGINEIGRELSDLKIAS